MSEARPAVSPPVLKELDSYRSAIREAFEEGHAAGIVRAAVAKAWERSEARQIDAQFAFTRIGVGSIVRELQRAALSTPAPRPDLPNIEIVAAAVHEAWMVQKRAKGITTAPSQQTGEEQMRPYAELSNEVQEYDRATVRAVYDAIHAAAGAAPRRADAPPPSFPVYQCVEWQCRHVFTDGRCCTLAINHEGPHSMLPNEPSEILAWLNLEQKRAERWFRRDSGVNAFELTAPELMRIRHALESAANSGARGSRDGWQPIETAPPTKGNGLHVLVYVPRYGLRPLIVEAWVNDSHPGDPWVAENGGQIEPTHWMALLAAPGSETP